MTYKPRVRINQRQRENKPAGRPDHGLCLGWAWDVVIKQYRACRRPRMLGSDYCKLHQVKI